MESYKTIELTILLLCGCLATSVAYYQQSCAGKQMLRSGGLTCADRQVILDAHNKARQKVALGNVQGQPAASNMLEMVWDEELAAVAQRWAEKCTLAHDSSRDVSRFPVGQNIAVTWTTRTNAGAAPDFPRQVTGWFNEVRNFAFYTTGFTKGTGHYSQLVWASTFLVGCGYSHYYDSSRGYTKLYVCNYGPGGNIIGARPYKVGGTACTGQGEAASSKYQGLCEMSGYPSLGASCKYNSPFNNYISTTYNTQNTQTQTYATRPFTTQTQRPSYQTQSPYYVTQSPFVKYTQSPYTKQTQSPYTKPTQSAYTKPTQSAYTKPTQSAYTKPTQSPYYTKQTQSPYTKQTQSPYTQETQSPYTKQTYATFAFRQFFG